MTFDVHAARPVIARAPLHVAVHCTAAAFVPTFCLLPFWGRPCQTCSRGEPITPDLPTTRHLPRSTRGRVPASRRWGVRAENITTAACSTRAQTSPTGVGVIINEVTKRTKDLCAAKASHQTLREAGPRGHTPLVSDLVRRWHGVFVLGCSDTTHHPGITWGKGPEAETRKKFSRTAGGDVPGRVGGRSGASGWGGLTRINPAEPSKNSSTDEMSRGIRLPSSHVTGRRAWRGCGSAVSTHDRVLVHVRVDLRLQSSCAALRCSRGLSRSRLVAHLCGPVTMPSRGIPVRRHPGCMDHRSASASDHGAHGRDRISTITVIHHGNGDGGRLWRRLSVGGGGVDYGRQG